MLEHDLTYDVLYHLFSYLDLDTAKLLRLVSVNTKSQAYEFVIKKVLKNAILEIKFDYEHFNVVAKSVGGNFKCLGGFDAKNCRPYRDWWEAAGRFDYSKRWKLFAGLFGTLEDGIVICSHLHLTDGTDLSEGELHVPFTQWASVVKYVCPSSCMFFCGGQQFYSRFYDLELVFCSNLPPHIDLTFREVEGIDLYSRLAPLTETFATTNHDVNVSIILQCSPDLGHEYITIGMQESIFLSKIST